MSGPPDLKLFVELAYLAAAILFILGLKMLSSPVSARRGNLTAAWGMGLAVVATVFDQAVFGRLAEGSFVGLAIILAGMLVGSLIGALWARKVAMTAMPQMVAAFNGSGGLAAALVSWAEYLRMVQRLPEGAAGLDAGVSFSPVLGALIGGISFTGSVLAWGKLQGVINERPLTFPGQRPVNFLLLLGTVALGVWLTFQGQAALFTLFLALALVIGWMFVAPIGGGDMPVVISLLNSFTGLATALTGFALENNVLIISGTLVGASGTLLTLLMCKAMNRSIGNVLFSAFGAAGGGRAKGAAGGAPKVVREVSVEDAAVMMAYARQVVIVPGYGLAVAQAQHVARELADMLEKRGVTVKYAIHPVAGRMPGHMNVLLAEANVPYTSLYDMDAINPELERTDVALVVGANDVVNPAARYDESSPIYGMPILDVDKCEHCIVLKRSMKPGFAGVDNELFYAKKTMMLFGDARESLAKLVNAVKEA
ncbi:MAG TPA: NAD(P)(+) transhydrogenase (Re/Si-specific) subunit beta [Candidatus Saccharimonadales bacterium]|nr:NAD(P)(+) transhydrogenase (Re/Si-specific) subunit beta [Candidatus Saccharimonadales bacterium]